MCQAIEFHGDMFRWSEIRRRGLRKDGANSAGAGAAAPGRGNSRPAQLSTLGKKRRIGRIFAS
jgi:hypothetical protein